MAPKYSQNTSNTVAQALHKFKRGTLKSGSRGKATSRAQAIAIGLSEARAKGYKAPARHHASMKTPAQLDREIAAALSGTKYASTYGHGPAEWQSGFDFAKESARHETHAEMRAIQRRLVDAARTDYDRGMVAGYAEALGDTPTASSRSTPKKTSKRRRSHEKMKKSPRPTPYQIKLTPSELEAVEFARGRYEWPDMLSKHAAEDGTVAFTESEMWQWTDDVDADDGRFALAAPALVTKLERFYDSRV